MDREADGPGFVRGAGALVRAARLALHRLALPHPRRGARSRHGGRRAACSTGPAIPHPAATRWRCACAAAFTRWSGGGEAPVLAPLYPPAPLPEPGALGAALAATLASNAETLAAWLDRAPQTNEVGRSAVLMAGLLGIVAPVSASRSRSTSSAPAPGSTCCSTSTATISAGDASAIPARRCGSNRTGRARRRPKRRSGSPAAGRRPQPAPRAPGPATGCSLISGRTSRDGSARLEAALALAAASRRRSRPGDAADWIERRLGRQGPAGRYPRGHALRRLSIFPAPTAQARVAGHIALAATSASAVSPLAWLRFEKAFSRR